MTVARDDAFPPRVEYVENGVTLTHPITFQFFDAIEITVTRILVDGTEIPLVLTTDYSVSGGAGETGSITKTGGGVNGATLRIDRNTVRSQEAEYDPGDDFPAEVHEEALDRLVMEVQEIRRDMLTVEDVRDIVADLLLAGPGISITVDDPGNTITINNTIDAEYIRDTIGAALVAGSNVTITVNDAANSITIAASGGGTTAVDALLLSGDQYDGGSGGGASAAEDIRDIIGTALVSGNGAIVTVDDAANTITIAADPEFIRDTIGSALVAGSNATITVNDAGNTITIAASGADPELVRDTIGLALAAGTNITVTVNDAGDTITIASTALAATFKGIVPTTRNAAFSFTNAMNGVSTDYTGSAAAATIDPQATTALDAGWTHVIRNNGSGVLTITRGAGVSLKGNGGVASANISLAVGGVATIVRWAANDFTISGSGLS
jgi:hypothetical protein